VAVTEKIQYADRLQNSLHVVDVDVVVAFLILVRLLRFHHWKKYNNWQSK